MNKKDLAIKLSKDKGITQQESLDYVNYLFDEITNEIKSGGYVRISGFGKFLSVIRPERTATNPKTGKTFHQPSRTVAKFEMGKTLKGLFRTDKSK